MLEFYYTVEISSRFNANQLIVDALAGYPLDQGLHAGIYYVVDAAAEFSFGKVFMLEFILWQYLVGSMGVWYRY